MNFSRRAEMQESDYYDCLAALYDKIYSCRQRRSLLTSQYVDLLYPADSRKKVVATASKNGIRIHSAIVKLECRVKDLEWKIRNLLKNVEQMNDKSPRNEDLLRKAHKSDDKKEPGQMVFLLDTRKIDQIGNKLLNSKDTVVKNRDGENAVPSTQAKLTPQNPVISDECCAGRISYTLDRYSPGEACYPALFSSQYSESEQDSMKLPGTGRHEKQVNKTTSKTDESSHSKIVNTRIEPNTEKEIAEESDGDSFYD